MTEEQKSKQVVEWSFSFDKVGESVNRALGKITGDEQLKHDVFTAPVAGTNAARIRFELPVGTAVVKALESGSDKLIEADLHYTGEIEFSVTGEAEKTVKLAQKNPHDPVTGHIREAISKFTNRDDLRWDVRLSPNIPLDLDIEGGVGPSTLDLSGLRLSGVTVEGGVGETHLTLPATDSSYSVNVEGGVGGSRVMIAEGAALRLKIEGGIGGVTIILPESTAARVAVKGGLGGTNLPSRFRQVKDNSDFLSKSGVWETQGFALATHQVLIDFDGGVGGLTVR